jgi:hypothetical protein
LNPRRDILVLVHPGSLCGSARSQIGKYAADAAREQILREVEAHHGGLVVIDGALSDELSKSENELIDLALMRNEAEGYIALRLWGCDSGEPPYPGWRSYGPQDRDAVFDCQQEAIATVSHLFEDQDVSVTGAWASRDGSSGCVCSVADILRDRLPETQKVWISDGALFEPEDFGERFDL